MKKDIINFNDKGQHHGYIEWYSYCNNLIYRGNRKNNNRIGYFEYHAHKQTSYYIR